MALVANGLKFEQWLVAGVRVSCVMNLRRSAPAAGLAHAVCPLQNRGAPLSPFRRLEITVVPGPPFSILRLPLGFVNSLTLLPFALCFFAMLARLQSPGASAAVVLDRRNVPTRAVR